MTAERWELTHRIADMAGESVYIPRLLAEGWEPFAVSGNQVWLRRIVPSDPVPVPSPDLEDWTKDIRR